MKSILMSKIFRKIDFRFKKIDGKKEDVFNLMLEFRLTECGARIRLFKFKMNSDKTKIVFQ